MMERVLTRAHMLSYSECDLTGHWKPSAVLQAAQDISVEHADLIGCGNAVLEEKGYCWLVSRQQYHFERYPQAGDTIRLTTWPGEPKRVIFPRYHLFEDVKGETLGWAATVWMLADKESKRLLSAQKTGVVMPDNRDRTPPIETPEKVLLPKEAGRMAERRVCYSDADINHHMNNTRYLEWACDLIEPSRFLREELCDFSLNYLQEATLGMTLQLQLVEHPADFYLMGTDRQDGREIFAVHGAWRQRVPSGSCNRPSDAL